MVKTLATAIQYRFLSSNSLLISEEISKIAKAAILGELEIALAAVESVAAVRAVRTLTTATVPISYQ